MSLFLDKIIIRNNNMFEKMMKCKKAWKEFCEWIKENHGYEFRPRFMDFWLEIGHLAAYVPKKIFILSIMPFFFDENNSDIEIRSDELNCRVRVNVIDKPKTDITFIVGDRLDTLISACEEAFEIREKQLIAKIK
jgi:hypothetical protein